MIYRLTPLTMSVVLSEFPNLFPLKYKQCEAKTKAITSIGIALKLILYI